MRKLYYLIKIIILSISFKVVAESDQQSLQESKIGLLTDVEIQQINKRKYQIEIEIKSINKEALDSNAERQSLQNKIYKNRNAFLKLRDNKINEIGNNIANSINTFSYTDKIENIDTQIDKINANISNAEESMREALSNIAEQEFNLIRLKNEKRSLDNALSQHNIVENEAACSNSEYDDVEKYEKEKPVRPIIDRIQAAVVLLRWKKASVIKKQFNSYKEFEINNAHNGKPQCSGLLLDRTHILSAGHCVQQIELYNSEGAAETPYYYKDNDKNPSYLTEDEIAKSMQAVFNYQLDRETDTSKKEEIVSILGISENEYNNDDNGDYVILEIAESEKINKYFVPIEIDTQNKDQRDAFILHFPTGRQKQISVGDVLPDGPQVKLSYTNISTEHGSSGASIFDFNGKLIGIHKGNEGRNKVCNSAHPNVGFTMIQINKLSKLLKSLTNQNNS